MHMSQNVGDLTPSDVAERLPTMDSPDQDANDEVLNDSDDSSDSASNDNIENGYMDANDYFEDAVDQDSDSDGADDYEQDNVGAEDSSDDDDRAAANIGHFLVQHVLVREDSDDDMNGEQMEADGGITYDTSLPGEHAVSHRSITVIPSNTRI